MGLRNQIYNDDFDEDEEDDAIPQGPGGARGGVATFGGAVQSVAKPMRTVVGFGVSATNTVSGVAGGTGLAGGITGALSTGVAGAMAPAAAVLGPAGIALAILDIGLSARSAAKTYAHMCVLEEILRAYQGNPRVRAGTMDAIAFTLQKKNKKLKRKGVGCIPILGSICNTVYTLGRTMQKRMDGTKGVERRRYAKVLWDNQLRGDPAAVAACEELLGVKTYTKIRIYLDGDQVLKKKVKSL